MNPTLPDHLSRAQVIPAPPVPEALNKFLTTSGSFLIFQSSETGALFLRKKYAKQHPWRPMRPAKRFMADLLYIGIILLFFIISGWYTLFCGKL
jgi:hypothetical protein